MISVAARKGRFPPRDQRIRRPHDAEGLSTVDEPGTLDGATADFTMAGANLAELYKLLGVVLPETLATRCTAT